MARGKHAKTAALREKRRGEERTKSLQQQIEHERAERIKAEEQVAEAYALIGEIDELRHALREQTAQEESELWAEIEALQQQLVGLQAEHKKRMTSRTSQDAVMAALLFGPSDMPHLNLSIEASEAILNEANRRMQLAHPDAGYRTDQHVTSGVADPAAKKLGVDAIKRLQRARGIR